MITFISENLVHFYLGSLLFVMGGGFEGCRRLIRRDRTARGIRP